MVAYSGSPTPLHPAFALVRRGNLPPSAESSRCRPSFYDRLRPFRQFALHQVVIHQPEYSLGHLGIR